MMHLMDSSQDRPPDFFRELLEHSEQPNPCELPTLQHPHPTACKPLPSHLIAPEDGPTDVYCTPEDGSDPPLPVPGSPIFLSEKLDRSDKSTQCQACLPPSAQHPASCPGPSLDPAPGQCLPLPSKSQKWHHYIKHSVMTHKSFGKTFKLSFPKKLVEMFLNHCELLE
jgi:hypothetical protein